MYEYGKWSFIDLRKNEDHRGTLLFTETPKDVPFTIQRVYVLTNSENKRERGNHAHRNLKQFMFALGGAFRINLNNGEVNETFTLNPSEKAVYISGLVWRSLIPQEESSTLVVLASEIYSEDDYVRDYKEFRSIANTLHDKGKQ
jgi:dTDP-4-dehydrorhamnose 3,5-epimerase-like enzyme